MNRDWYQGFFQGIVVEMWRSALPAEYSRREVDLLEKELRLEPGASVLDVPCGHGRLSIDLASRGYRVTGIDLSGDEIEEARRRSAAAELSVEWIHGDMRELPAGAAYEAAFCFGNSFGYLGREGDRAFVEAIPRVLPRGARFALDYGMAAECILPRFQVREEAQVGDILFEEESVYHATESLIETRYTFTRGDERVTRTGLHSVYTARELTGLLDEVGLRVVSTYGSAEGEPFRLGSNSLILIAERV
jgi:SAM-dependent methyltransferase